jgi:hypothetical protein
MALIQFGEALLAGAVCSVTLPDATKFLVQRVTENDPIVEGLGSVKDENGVVVNRHYAQLVNTITVEFVPEDDFVMGTTFPAMDNITIGADKWFVASAPSVREALPIGWTVRLEKWNLAKVVVT